jgi:hypothetical protein
MSTITNNNFPRANLDNLPLAHLALISSFGTTKDQEVTKLVSKHLNRIPQLPQNFQAQQAQLLQNFQPRQTQQSGAQGFPFYILDYILSFIPTTDLGRLQEVGSDFYKNRLKATTLNLRGKPVNDEKFTKLLEKSRDVYVRLDLSRCFNFLPQFLTHTARLKNIHSLNLTSCNFKDSDIVPLAKSHVRSLNLSFCPNIYGKSLGQFIMLKRLDLTGCRLIPAAYTNLSQASSLEVLILAQTEATDKNMKDVRGTRAKTNLKRIDLSNCKNITHKGLVSIFTKDFRDQQIKLKVDDRIKLPKMKTKVTPPRHKNNDPLRKGEDGTDDQTYIKKINDWRDSIKSKRISELYQHPGKLKEHFEQIQNELNGMTWKKFEGMSGDVCKAAENAQKDLHAAVLKVQQNKKYPATEPIAPLVFPLLPGKDIRNL